MSSITCKFGGTSLASAERIRAAMDIVRANRDRRYIVCSAPGKRSGDDKKITDTLFGWFHMVQDGLDPTQPIEIVRERFRALNDELDANFDVDQAIDAIAAAAPSYDTSHFLTSRGEYLNAKIIASAMKATFVEPGEFIRFTYENHLDNKTYSALAEALQGDGIFVIPGYYGANPDGQIRTFSRGGSDVTGAVVARASNSVLYENWTDVSGIRMTDPRIVPDAKRIDEITYSELRELAYMGASVLHDEAIFPVRETGIPIEIRNTHAPNEPGTRIVRDRETDYPVCGIAARAGCSMLNIDKTLMNREVGFARRVLSILEEHQVSIEHMPTGIDTISVIVKDENLGDHGDSIVGAIERVCEPDAITLRRGIALIATVGKAMNHHVGVAARLCTALAEAGVNILVLDQGSSEMNIIVGVEESDMNRAVQAIYRAFESWK